MNVALSGGTITAEPLTEDFGLTIGPANCASPFDAPREEIIEACKSSGAVYFHGFDFTMEQFEMFTDLYCHDWLTYQGGAHDRQVLNPGSDKSVYSVMCGKTLAL